MSTSYEDLLDRSWDEIPDVTALPVGQWRLKLKNSIYKTPDDPTKNSFFMFFYQPQTPHDDVDEEALAELDTDDYASLCGDIVYMEFIENNADVQKVISHLAKHGVEMTPGKSIRDAMKEAKGTEIDAYLDTRERDGKTENDPKSFAAVED